MSWGDLFERAKTHEVTVDDVRAALVRRREEGDRSADEGVEEP